MKITKGMAKATIVVSSLGLSLGVIGFSPLANAAVIDNAVTTASTSATNPRIGENIVLSATWRVPNGSKAGDTFTLNIPKELTVTETSFELKNSAGDVVANAAVIDGNIVVTLSNYVTTNPNNVNGNISFDAQINSSAVEGQDIVVDWNGQIVTITPAAAWVAGQVPSPTKYSWGDDGWTIEIPGKSENTNVYDSPEGATIECDSLRVDVGDQTTGYPSSFETINDADISCDKDGFDIINVHIPDNQLVRVVYNVKIENPDTAKEYYNNYSVNSDVWDVSDRLTQSINHAGGDGDGDPDNPTPTEEPTENPTTDPVPTTDVPTPTEDPTVDPTPTDDPTTVEPTDEPTTDDPTTENPTVDPTTDAPTPTDNPTTDAPATDDPTDNPTTVDPSDEPTETLPNTNEPTNTDSTTDSSATKVPDNNATTNGVIPVNGNQGNSSNDVGSNNSSNSSSNSDNDTQSNASNNDVKRNAVTANSANGASVHTGGETLKNNAVPLIGGIGLVSFGIVALIVLFIRRHSREN